MNQSLVILIAAMANNRAIGFNNTLPWRFSADLKRFKSVTMGHSIVMGRKTFESLGHKPLPGRKNIVVSTKISDVPAGVFVVKTLALAIQLARMPDAASPAPAKIFIIGGAQIYGAALHENLADEIDLTVVNLDPVADTFFPEFESKFQMVSDDASESDGTRFRLQRWTKN